MSVLTYSIIIPNYNGEKLIYNQLQKITKFISQDKIIVIDDCSTDKSIDIIKTNFPKIKLILNSERVGFSLSVNRAVEQAECDIIVLLNSDVIPTSNFLRPLLDNFRNDEKVFSVACQEKSVEPIGTISRGRSNAYWKNGLLNHFGVESKDGIETAWASCGSSAFSRDIWLKMGGLDRLYSPFYWEDIDLSYRAKKAGYKVIFEKDSIVFHYHDKGSIKNHFSENYIKIVDWRNHLLFIWKNVSNFRILLANYYLIIKMLIKSLIKFDYIFPLAFVSAIYRFLFIYLLNKKNRIDNIYQDTQIFQIK